MDEVDFKISAVFSLVGESNDDAASPPNFLKGSDETDSNTFTGDANSSTDTAASDEGPPTLTSEVDSNADDEDLRKYDINSTCINAVPPILHMETVKQNIAAPPKRKANEVAWLETDNLQMEVETIRQMIAAPLKPKANEMAWLVTDKMSPNSQLRKKIAPSYIVLNSVERFLTGKTSISYRKYKRIFSDCTNMCKKMYFIRRLKSGRDVFNVKTPSKQKDYYLYLEDKKIANLRKNKLTGMKSLKSILNMKCFNISERNTSNEHHMKRVRRVVTTLPNDFKSLSSIMNKQDLGLADDDLVDDEERLKRRVKLENMKQHALDALVLSKQIEIKRSHNKTMKKLKCKSKAKSNSEARNITKEGVTSSVSGRVRKPNLKYFDGFAIDLNEINEHLCVEKTNNRLKKLSNDANLVKQKRQNEDDPHAPATKKPKPVVCIDNPEMESETRIKSSTGDRKRSKKLQRKRLPIMTDLKTRLLEKMSSGKGPKDGVLIQEMPNEGSLIADMLQGKVTQPYPIVPKPAPSATTIRTSVANFLQNMKRHSHTSTATAAAVPVSANGRTSLTTNTTAHLVGPFSFNTLNPVSMNKLGPYSQTIKTIANATVPASANGRSQVSNNTTETVHSVVSTSSRITAPMLVKTAHGLKYVVPNSTATTFTPKPVVTIANKAPVTSVTPIVVTVKSDGSLQSLLAMQPPTQTNVTTCMPQHPSHNKANISLLGGGSSLLPLLSYGNPTIAAKPLRHSSGQIPTVVPQTVQCSLTTATQKWSPAQTIFKLQPTTAQSIPTFTSNSQVVARYPLIAGPKSVVNTSFVNTLQGTNMVSTPPVSVKPVSVVTLSANITGKSNPKYAVPATKTTQVSIKNTTQTVKTNDAMNATEKSKFYLLKIDGKNVLIPVDGCQFQPKAYVVNNDVASQLSTPTSQTTTRTIVSSASVMHKPTLAVEPSVKVHLDLPPPIKIKQEPLDDWSEHLMKTTVSAPSSTRPSNIANYTHRSEPNTNLNMENQHMQDISGNLSAKQLLTNHLIRKEHAVSSISVQGNSVSATSTGIDVRHSSIDRVDSNASVNSNNEDKAKHETVEEKKPLAFTEALTAREERLRKLKELRKEKQMALEAIRSIKTENE